MSRRDVNHGRYILAGKIPVPCEDLSTWANWIANCTARVVKQEDIGPYYVSTVFLGLDHNFGKGPPLLFESMIFRDHESHYESLECSRTSTWELALEQHAKAVAWARRQLDS
jgi:hypothetical protein